MSNKKHPASKATPSSDALVLAEARAFSAALLAAATAAKEQGLAPLAALPRVETRRHVASRDVWRLELEAARTRAVERIKAHELRWLAVERVALWDAAARAAGVSLEDGAGVRSCLACQTDSLLRRHLEGMATVADLQEAADCFGHLVARLEGAEPIPVLPAERPTQAETWDARAVDAEGGAGGPVGERPEQPVAQAVLPPASNGPPRLEVHITDEAISVFRKGGPEFRIRKHPARRQYQIARLVMLQSPATVTLRELKKAIVAEDFGGPGLRGLPSDASLGRAVPRIKGALGEFGRYFERGSTRFLWAPPADSVVLDMRTV